MASLNTLRTKFGVVLSVVIGLALLAFVLSLKTEMGFSGSDPKVGVIDGNKINYSEYLEEYDRIKSQSGASEGDEQQTERLVGATWQSLIAKYVLSPGFDEMGLGVSEAERLAMISGERMSQTFFNAFGDPRTGAYNSEAVSQFLTQAETSVESQQAWSALNTQARMERQYQKYMGLIKGGAFVNSLEVTNGLQAANTSFSGQWASKKYASVPDSLIEVSNSEIRDYYKSHKALFQQTPSRTISYVTFEVEPSQADLTALEATVNEVNNEFSVTTELKSFVRGNRNGKIAESYVSASQLPQDEAEALMADKQYGPVLKNNTWTMARVLDAKMFPDSLGVRHIVLPAAQEKMADSLLVALRAGADFAQTAAKYSVYEATAANGGEVGVLPFSAFTGEFAEALGSAKQGDIVKIISGEAVQLMQVYRADAPTKHIQVATIIYPVEASVDTKRVAHNAAGTFTVNAKGSLEAFNEAATTAALTPRVASLAQGERMLRGLDDSREVARWIYEAKKGALSEIFSVGDNYLVAIVTEIDDKEYAPLEKVAAQVKSAVLRDKKYDYIVKNMTGTALTEQAQSLGSEVTPFADVNFASFYVEGLGYEPRVIGAIAATKKQGTVSAPVKGATGVYVFVVDNIANSEKQTVEAEKVRAQAMAESMAQQMSMSAVQQMAKVQNLGGRYF